MNNRDLARRVLDAFLTSNVRLLNDLDKLADARNWPDLARAAHRLKGASDNVAAPRLRKLAAEMETLALSEPNDVARPLGAIRDEWPRFQERAHDYLGRDD